MQTAANTDSAKSETQMGHGEQFLLDFARRRRDRSCHCGFYASKTGIPLAMIAYKRKSAEIVESGELSFETIAGLAGQFEIPALMARHEDDFSSFHVIPLNNAAHECCPQSREYSEQEWLELLELLRDQAEDSE